MRDLESSEAFSRGGPQYRRVQGQGTDIVHAEHPICGVEALYAMGHDGISQP